MVSANNKFPWNPKYEKNGVRNRTLSKYFILTQIHTVKTPMTAVHREKTREERASHALSLVYYNTNILKTSISKSNSCSAATRSRPTLLLYRWVDPPGKVATLGFRPCPALRGNFRNETNFSRVVAWSPKNAPPKSKRFRGGFLLAGIRIASSEKFGFD